MKNNRKKKIKSWQKKHNSRVDWTLIEKSRKYSVHVQQKRLSGDQKQQRIHGKIQNPAFQFRSETEHILVITLGLTIH